MTSEKSEIKNPGCDRILAVEVFFRPDLRTGVMVMLRTVLKWDISEPFTQRGQNQWSLWAAASIGTVEAILCVRNALRPSVSILEPTPSTQNLSCVVTTRVTWPMCPVPGRTTNKAESEVNLPYLTVSANYCFCFYIHTFLSKILDTDGKQAGKKIEFFSLV